jgi:hypothetical protein
VATRKDVSDEWWVGGREVVTHVVQALDGDCAVLDIRREVSTEVGITRVKCDISRHGHLQRPSVHENKKEKVIRTSRPVVTDIVDMVADQSDMISEKRHVSSACREVLLDLQP